MRSTPRLHPLWLLTVLVIMNVVSATTVLEFSFRTILSTNNFVEMLLAEGLVLCSVALLMCSLSQWKKIWRTPAYAN